MLASKTRWKRHFTNVSMYDIVTFDIIGYKTKRLVDLERNIIEIIDNVRLDGRSDIYIEKSPDY